jgi:PAS domain S-box-containing protein
MLVDNINDGVYTLDDNGKFTFVNKVIEDRSGLTAEKFKKLNFKDIVNPNDVSYVTENFEKIMNGEDVPPYELRYIKGDGGSLTVEVNTKPVLKDGKIIGLQGISRDITERKKAEEVLKNSEIQLRTILNSMGDAIHVIDKDYKFIMMNENFITWNKELDLETDVEGKKLFDIFPFLKENVIKEYSEVFEKGNIITSEEQTVIKDEQLFTETRKIPIFENDEVTKVITIIRNITKRKLNEERLHESDLRYRLIFENSPDSITLVDKSGVIIDCNRSTETLVGYTKKEIIGKKYAELLTLNKQDLPKLINKHRKLLKGEAIDPYEIEIIRKDKTRRFINVKNSVFKKDDEILGFMVITRDITDLKRDN